MNAMSVELDMKLDGRTLDHKTLEQIRRIAVQRVREGEKPVEVIASFGFCRTTIQMDASGSGARQGTEGIALHTWHRTSAPAYAETGTPGISLDQRPQSIAVRFGLRTVDAADRLHPDQEGIRRACGRHRRGGVAG